MNVLEPARSVMQNTLTPQLDKLNKLLKYFYLYEILKIFIINNKLWIHSAKKPNKTFKFILVFYDLFQFSVHSHG